MSLFLFWGQEDYNIEVEIEKLKEKLLDSSFKSMNYKVLDNPDFLSIIECAQNTTLMFGNMLIVINCDKYLVGNKANVDDKQLGVLAEALASISDAVNIVFLCKIPRDENKKIDTRKKLYKIIAKYAQVTEFPQYKTYQKELPPILQKMVKAKELAADTNAITFLIEQLGSNLRLIDSELEKLKIAIYPRKQISKEDIKNICVSCDDIFALADLIVSEDKNEVLKQFHQLIDRKHYLEVLSVLQGNIQRFVFIKNYSTKATAKEIAMQLKLHEFVVIKTLEKLKNISLARLVQIKENLTQAEYKIKSGKITSPQVALELALLS